MATAFKGNLFTKKPVTEELKTVEVERPTAEKPVLSFKVPPVKSEEEKLRKKVTELELKVQILEHTKEGTSRNDKEYIEKLENLLKTEKAVARALMLQNVDLRMLCGKYAEHLPKIDVTEDGWQERLGKHGRVA